MPSALGHKAGVVRPAVSAQSSRMGLICTGSSQPQLGRMVHVTLQQHPTLRRQQHAGKLYLCC